MIVGVVVGILAKVEYDAHKRKQRKKRSSVLTRTSSESYDEILSSLRTINSKLEIINQTKG
jgi:hypothetical protein